MTQIDPARLYIVATPIGNLNDMTPRAIETLQSVDLIAAEDTRHSGHLLQHHQIKTPMVSLHEHNEQQKSEVLLHRLQKGESIALISDAGTPLISDPGYRLVTLIKQNGITVVPVPGACALIAALSSSGLPSDRFTFEGFLPAKQGNRRQVLERLRQETATLIFYESPRRLKATLEDINELWGSQRLLCLARELTKLHETILTLPASELLEYVTEDNNQQRGECVLLAHGAEQQVSADEQELQRILTILLEELPVRKAAAVAAGILGVGKNQAYQVALEIKQ